MQNYPQSVVKKAVLSLLIETYQQLGDGDKTVAAASKQLQIDPSNMEAIFASVYVKKGQCNRTQDASVCDDAGALARKGLSTAKPAEMSDADWKKQTAALYPVFHSTIALDDAISKKDYKGAIEEYKQELMLLPAEATQSGAGLFDTLLLAEAYSKVPEPVNAVWFYARAWNFAPAGPKAQIESKLNYWYKKFHGGLDGLDAVKAQAAATVFPKDLVIKPAKTPAEFAHDAMLAGDPMALNLGDKEFILANGVKDDQDKLWALLKDKQTPVPGIVIEATATVIKVALSDDAKAAKTADFVINLKEPLADKDIPAAGVEMKLMKDGGPELDGTYDTFTLVPATATAAQSVQIVLKDGLLQAEKKKAAPAHKPAAKPAAGHKRAAQ